VADHRVKLTLTLFLPHDLAEWITARAIPEGKNTPGVIEQHPRSSDAAGETSPSVAAGVYLLLAPLSVGSHVLSVGAKLNASGASVATEFRITVVP
jgi:hypothetical protein